MSQRTQLLDSSWAGRAFLMPKASLEDTSADVRRYYTSSSRKFTNTSLGGSIEINPLPQFTENADLAHPSYYAGNGNDPRMAESRFYGEVIRDNAQVIHFRAGVPKFNDLTTFFGNFYNVNAGAIVRTGREPGVLYALGRVVGTIGTLPLQPFILAGAAIRFFAGIPRGKYYYFKDTMYPYWTAVQNMMNGFMAPMGLITGFVPETHTKFFDKADLPGGSDMEASKRIYGNMVNHYGAFDVFSVATRAQRLANDFRDKMQVELDKLSGDPSKRAEEQRKVLRDGMIRSLGTLTARHVSLYNPAPGPGASGGDLESAYQAFQGKTEENWTVDSEKDDSSENWFQRAGSEYAAQRRMGGQFVSFRVNNTGAQSSSFNNQAGQSSIQDSINAMSSKARQIRFGMADGNISGGAVGKAVEFAKTSVMELLSGALQSVQLSGLMAVAGNAFADIQKLYESSSADLNRTSFEFSLRSYAADDMIRCQTLFLPLAAILALGLPRATGPASYDGPFLLEVFNQGKSTIREGMIESINISVGSGVAGWAPGMKPLSIDVSVTVVDMSSIMSMMVAPVSGTISSIPGSLASVFGEGAREAVDTGVAAINMATYSEDNTYSSWMSTMASLPLEGFTNSKRKWQLAMARQRAAMDQARSPGAIASWGSDTLPGRLDRWFMQEETNRY